MRTAKRGLHFWAIIFKMRPFFCLLDVHILSVLSITAFLLTTRTPGVSPSPPGWAAGGRISVAFVTATDAGKIIGRMSSINGNRDAILLRYLPGNGIRERIEGKKVGGNKRELV
jgi:hypothetical protein